MSRFIQPDTITPSGPQGLNRYSYVNNNPVNFNDPTGHMLSCALGECGSSSSGSGNGGGSGGGFVGGSNNGFSDDDIEDILSIASDGDFITYTVNGDTQVAMFALDPDNNLVLYDVGSKSLIDIYSVADFGSGFYTYNVSKGEYELNPSVEAFAVDQNNILLMNPEVYGGEYNLSIEYNYYYDYKSPEFIMGNFWLVVSTYASIAVATGGAELIPIGAGVIADLTLTTLFGAEIDPNNPMDVRVSPAPPLPNLPQIINDPEGYFSPFHH